MSGVLGVVNYCLDLQPLSHLVGWLIPFWTGKGTGTGQTENAYWPWPLPTAFQHSSFFGNSMVLLKLAITLSALPCIWDNTPWPYIHWHSYLILMDDLNWDILVCKKSAVLQTFKGCLALYCFLISTHFLCLSLYFTLLLPMPWVAKFGMYWK